MNRIEDCYSRSNVVALIETAGGFYGRAETTGNFKNVYSTGTVSSPDSAGGFVGKVGNLNVSNAHFDSTNAPYDAVGGFLGAPATLDITGHPTADMKTVAFKNTLNTNNPTGVWSIDPAINDGYLYLNTQPLLATGDVQIAQNDIQVTPTQVDSTLRIISAENNASYVVVGMSGKVSARGTVSGNQKQINVSTLTKGIYIINVKTATGNKSIKFIKK